MKHVRFITLALILAGAFGAQSLVVRSEQRPAAAPAATGDGVFDALHFRPIGPASMSGRISDLAVYESNPSIYYVGTAHGGVWKTTNNGTTFEAQFQDLGLMSIGAIAVSQNNPDLVWVGTGESNNRQSTSWGDGVYKSTDGGKTYVNVGLKTSRFINRIVIDPRNNDVVFVAATGSLWGPGGERGVYKTVDGGKTWKQVLEVDDDTGANDLVIDATSNKVLYASTYQRRRTQCCMNGGGSGSGLWKSTDAGETWTRLSGGGIPEGPLGRIALDVYRKRPNILYSLIEGPVPPPARGGGAGAPPAAEPAGGQGGGRSNISTGVNDQPTGLYRSDDGGATWRKVNNANQRPMYFSQIRVDPNDPEVIIYGGVGLHMSTDGGKTVNTAAAPNIHVDHHAIWINPANSNHVLIGNDGGLAVTWDQAKTWNFLQNLPVGLFYHVGVDMATPYNICGGMQDNYSWCGPSAVRGTAGIAGFTWQTMQGGDGFVVLQDPGEFRIAFSESQDGNMVRIDRVTGETMSIRPQSNLGEPPIRWNWDTPLVMSPHDPKIIYAAGNKLFRSSNRGLNWETVGTDLTSNANRDEIVTMGVKGSDIRIAKNDGIQAWPTIISLAESAKRTGVIYAGTDDGIVQVSRDGGRSWSNITDRIPGLPKGIWVSEVVPSRFDEGTVYATFDGHRLNDFETYIYVSRDFGQTWQSAVANLKGEIARTLTEDQKNPDVLYLGTETGLFVSIDRAKSWMRLKANLPTVRIDEITLHPRDNAMILATHGRALWVLDHLEPIQEYAAAQAVTTADAKLFTPPPYAMYRRPARDRNYEFWGDQTFYGENPPTAARISWFNKKQVGDVKLKIADATGREVRELAGPALARSNMAGIQTACWDLRVQPAPAPPPAPGGRGPAASTSSQAATTTAPSPSTASPTTAPSPSTASPATAPEGRPAAGGSGQPQEPNPFGAGCGAPAGTGGGGFGGPAVNVAGPFVIGGVYQVSLIVDGKTVDTKPLRVNDDPDIVLTSVERKRMFDMAMEIHAVQPRLAEASAAHASLTRQATELATTLGSRSDVPGSVKTSFEEFNKELAALAPKLTTPQGRGGGGGRGATESLMAKVAQAKTGLMGGMSPGDQTVRAYTEVKAQSSKAIADLNAVLTKATAVSAALAPFNLTLTVPAQVQPPPATPARRSSSGM
jgi:photosystem II stability/assembly factor-like uncharacterized protein